MVMSARCGECGLYVALESEGKLEAHNCPSRKPEPPNPNDYTVGYDSEPRWVMRGGLIERDPRTH